MNNALVSEAEALIARAHRAGVMIGTAESCTGGLVAACLTASPGASAAFACGFITYSNDAKIAMLGVDAALFDTDGAVSQRVAEAMALGVLGRSPADLAISVTGVAGPGGGSVQKPVGLVHLAAVRKGASGALPQLLHERHMFSDIGRAAVREASVLAALRLAARLI
jgi:nicotinamide-nucleotide amidase